MITSRLTSRARTTVPRAVRTALKLRAGDDLAYVIEGDKVLVSRAAQPLGDPFATFVEWDSEADRSAFADL